MARERRGWREAGGVAGGGGGRGGGGGGGGAGAWGGPRRCRADGLAAPMAHRCRNSDRDGPWVSLSWRELAGAWPHAARMAVLVVHLERKRVVVRQPGVAAGSRIGVFHDHERFDPIFRG